MAASLRFRRPSTSNEIKEPTIFPPTIYTNATYSRGILIPNNDAVTVDKTDGNDTEEVIVPVPSDYTTTAHVQPALSPQEATVWNHSIAAHAASRRRPPMEIGRLLGTITFFFEEVTAKNNCNSRKRRASLHEMSRKYYNQHGIQKRNVNKKDGGKHKILTMKQALMEACPEADLDPDTTDIASLPHETQTALQKRSQQIHDYWKHIRDNVSPLHECWHKRHGGFIPQSLGDVISSNAEEEFYVPIVTLLEWLDTNAEAIVDLASDRKAVLYGGLRRVNTDARSVFESLMDLSCPNSLYKIPLVTPYAVASQRVDRNKTIRWKIRIGVYMNRLLPEVLTESNLHCVMCALDENSYIVSQPLHLPPMRELNDPVFESSKYPIVQMDELLEDEKKEEEDEDEGKVSVLDPVMLGSTRETKTISPFTPRGLLKLLENTGNVTTDFPQIATSLASYLKLDLMLHQQHAVCWMRQMEKLPGFGINSIIWEERNFLDGNKYYYSPALGQIRLNRPPVTVGGCVADEMGLGKTIQMLSLIACSLDELKNEARAGENTNTHTHTTLIVVPPALVAQWVAEVEKCCGESLSVNILDVNDNDFMKRNLVESGGNGNDILVTTYSALDNAKTSRYLASWTWGRIVLDEQQEIRSSTTKIAKNCESLDCHRRWMLSGTPIFEGIEDLRGELNFLRLTPYAARWEDGFFDFSIMKHWQHQSEHGIETLRILGLLILRRSKDMTICETGLPIMNQKKLTVELVPVPQTDSERALYCWFEYLVSQEISRKDGQSNLKSRDLCLRLLREICFSAVLINGGLGAASQMRNLNLMYRRLLGRVESNDDQKRKKAGVIKFLSPPKALAYLSQVERNANVGEEFVSEQQFGGGQGCSSRTYAIDSIDVQIENAQKSINDADRKATNARRKRAQAHWQLAMELITTGSLSKDKEVLSRVSTKVSSLWKWRLTSKEETRGWRPSLALLLHLHSNRCFAWAHPTSLQLVNIPSQVTPGDISCALLGTLREEPKVTAKLDKLRTRLANTEKDDDKKRILVEISAADVLLQKAIANDKQLQAPVVQEVKSPSSDKKIAYVQLSSEDTLERLLNHTRSNIGIPLKSKESVPHIQAAIDKATQNLKQAEAALTVHPCAKNKQEHRAAQKSLSKVQLGLTINNTVLSSRDNVIMSRALKARTTAPRTKTALLEGASATIALAVETLEQVLPRLRDGKSTLDRLMLVLEKKGDRQHHLSQKSAFDTLEAMRKMAWSETFCPICQLQFGMNAGNDPAVENPIAAMISCGHFFCIKCLDRHAQEEIRNYRALTCPCCRKGFSQANDVVHIDHLSTDDAELAAHKRASAKSKVMEASELLETSDGILEGSLWHHLFLSIDVPTNVSNAPHRVHTALPQDVLAHFRAATMMKIDCNRPESPSSWTTSLFQEKDDLSGLSSKIQMLLNDLPQGERSVIFSSSKEGVLHLTAVIKAFGIECYNLYTGATNSDATEHWVAAALDSIKVGPVIVIQAGAAASGLTLTAASKIFLMEPFNRTEEEAQAYARCHRYGQTNDVHVKVYYAPVSVEARLLRWRKRSGGKFTTNNAPKYIYSELYCGKHDDATADFSLGEDSSEEDFDEIRSNSAEEQSAEVHEENIRTQFLLGLVDEHGNPVGGEAPGDHAATLDRPVSGRRFILG